MRSTNLLRLAWIAVALSSAACGGPAKPTETPSAGGDDESSKGEDAGASESPMDGGSPNADTQASADTADGEKSAPLASVLVTDSSEVQKIYDAASSAPAVSTHGKGSGPALRALRELAKKAAPGMKPDGSLGTGTLKEKHHLQMDVTLEPGRCYAVLGSAPKAKDLDLYLLTPPGILAAQDTTDDNKPVIGRAPAPMCPASSRAVTYKLDIFADVGGGDVAVQLYSRPDGKK